MGQVSQACSHPAAMHLPSVQLWSRLPRACQAAWEKLQQRSEAGEAPAEAPELRQLLEAFAAGTGVWYTAAVSLRVGDVHLVVG